MFFEKPKLICKSMFAFPEFYLDNNQVYCGFSFSTIIQNEKYKKYKLEYLLGIMNSKLGAYWFNINGKKRGIGVDIGVKVFRMFPVPKITNKNKKNVDNLVKLVKDISKAIKLKQEAKTQSDIEFFNRKINNYENNINQVVYEIFELKQGEIEIIENK